jgi:hypothetical protein
LTILSEETNGKVWPVMPMESTVSSLRMLNFKNKRTFQMRVSREVWEWREVVVCGSVRLYLSVALGVSMEEQEWRKVRDGFQPTNIIE